MNTLKSLVTNPTVISFVALFLDGGLKAVDPATPIWLQGIIGAVIVFIGVKFHLTAVSAARASASK